MTLRRHLSKSRARHRCVVGALLAATVGAGCSGSPRPADTVVYASGTDLESANPITTIHPLSRQVQRHVLFVTLARYDSVLAPQPYFARRWTWSDDRRVLRLFLYRGLRWHDGTRTTASDVAFTLRVARDRAAGYARASDLAGIDAVRVLADTLVELRFTVAQRDLPGILCELPIIPEHLLKDVPPGAMRGHAFATAPTGNGPFRFVQRVAGQRWTFVRNEEFPPELGGPPAMRELVVAVVDEPTTKFAGLAAGDLDFAGIGPTMASLADRDPMIDVVDYPVLFSTALVFNVQRAPFADERVRRAVDLSIDRERIISAALAGYATPASGPVPPESPLHVLLAREGGAAQADSLLDAAGFRRGADGARALRLELLTVGSGDNALEQLVQADLGARGIRVEIRQMELAAFLTRVRATRKDFDVVVTGIPGDLSLAYLRSMYESAFRGGALDYSAYHTATLDAHFARAARAATDAELRGAWVDVQRELARTVPAAWIYHSRGLQGVSSRMRGVRMDLRGEMATVARWSAAGVADATRP
jgi:peptide/nickel transport system substrate-binding protein